MINPTQDNAWAGGHPDQAQGQADEHGQYTQAPQSEIAEGTARLETVEYSRGESKFDAYPVQWDARDFDGFEYLVLEDRALAKGRQYVCNPMASDADGKPHRCNAGSLPRRWVPFDFDGFSDAEAFSATVEYLHRYRGFSYCTASHTPSAPRARAIIEASRPMDADEGKRVCLALEARIVSAVGEGAIKFDRSVYGPSQPLYCPPVGADSYHFGGVPVDVDALLAEEPAEAKTGSAARHEATPAQFPTVTQVVALRDALTYLDPDDRQTWVDGGHDLYPAGEVGYSLWDEWSQRSGKYDPKDSPGRWAGFSGSGSSFKAVFTKALAVGWRPAARPDDAAGEGQEPPPPEGDPGPWTDACDETGEPPDHAARPLRRRLGAVPAKVPDPATLIATESELEAAHLHPRRIVDRHTYADLAQVIAPGGTGKTTLLIYEAVHIAIGRPLWGLDVLSPGWTLFVTAEDQRTHLLARLREILRAMDLTEEERAVAIAGFRVWDVAGEQVKLIHTTDGNIVMTDLADAIVTACQAAPPAVVVFDPLVSFGASEQAVNDNEQGIVTAARRIVKGLNCCVRLVHHTGKGNAREKTLDQYSGRGGSAMPDGSRMTTVLQAWTPDDGGTLRPPAGCTPDQKASITILARAKLSYSPPNLPLIWVRRTGFAFEHFTELPVSREEARAAKESQLLRFLASEVSAGKYHSQKTLEDAAEDIGMTRAKLRCALSGLRARLEVYDADLPEDLRKGGRKTYLSPSNLAGHVGEVPPSEAAFGHPHIATSTTSPPLRDGKSGEVAALFHSPCPSNLAKDTGEVAARSRGSEPEPQEKPEQGSVPGLDDDEVEL